MKKPLAFRYSKDYLAWASMAEADAEDDDATLLEIGVIVAEPTILDGSARRSALG